MKRLYSIEFLRVWFLSLIVLVHTSVVSSFESWSTFAKNVLHSFGSRVDIFMLICGFFLYKSVNKNETNFISVLKHRAKRILPALILYKILVMIFFDSGHSYFLTNLMMLNANIGISIPTISHIVWYVDVMFWCYLFYAALFAMVDKTKALFATSILMFLSLMMLFTSQDVNLHFQLLNNTFIDGGVLRCFAFMGMGILLSVIPNNNDNNTSKSYLLSVVEFLSLVMVFLYPGFVKHDSGMVLNHVLWAVVFIFLAQKEYGYVFSFLNKQTWINYVSKYCYETYVFQLFAITLGTKWFSPHQAPILTGFGIIVLSFVFGKIVKDYIEPFIFNMIKKL